MITETYSRRTGTHREEITVITRTEETEVLWYTDSVHTGGPYYYEPESRRLHSYIQEILATGYELLSVIETLN